MAKKKKDFEIDFGVPTSADITFGEMHEVDAEYQMTIENDPKYSLEVDPTGIYNFSDLEIEFIEQMVQYKNVQFVSSVICGISVEEGVQIYKKYAVKEEIKRINLAMYARRFCSRMADLNQLGGYLTTALTDENIAIADRLSPKEKLTAAKLLVSLNLLKREAMNHPEVVDAVEIQKDLDKLSPNELKKLIEYNEEDMGEKERLIEIINKDNMLTMEELTNLKTMTIAELEDLVKIITAPEPEEVEESENNDEEN